MLSYMEKTGRKSHALAKLFGVSHSQMYMARERNVGAKNAEKIASGMASLLGLGSMEKLELKAEIMGHPDNLLRAFVEGNPAVEKKLDLSDDSARRLYQPDGEIGLTAANRALRVLEEADAPQILIEAVRSRIKRKPPGKRTHDQRGLELRNKRAVGIYRFTYGKPRTSEALRRSGLSKKGLYERAGVGKETLRSAMYERCGRKPAEAISGVLAEVAGLSEVEKEAVYEELLAPPKVF